MAFDVAKCMIRTPEQTREDIVSTTDLIAELCRREGVRCINVTLNDYFEVILNRNDTDYPDIEPDDYGPAKIIVVPGSLFV